MTRRSVRFALLALALLLATGLGYGAYLLSRLVPIGTAYAAKTLCSGVFVMGRPAEVVMREDVVADNHPLLRVVSMSVDATRQAATARFLRLAPRTAAYRPGLGCTLALGVSVAELQASAAAAPPSTATPQRTSVDLPSAPESGIDEQRLNAVVDLAFREPDPDRLQRTRALLVLHDGHVITERYATGFSAQTPLPGWSMTKSVTGVLIGVLVRAGKLVREQNGLLPQWGAAGDPRREITLDQLLRMTSGLRFSENYGDPDEDVLQMLFASADGAAFAIDKPLDAAPGTRWRYSSGSSNILSRIIRLAVGGKSQDYLEFPRRALFDRIGMESAVIETDASGNFVSSSFMYARARDWARFGQFLLQDGVWQGERIVPEGWVHYMAKLTPQSTRRDFGAHLWLKIPPPFDDPTKALPQLPADVFHVVGYEGQFVSVIPSRRLVVVRLGLSRREHAWNHHAFLVRLLEALPQ
jgi:CubicO group peptidase (beta-lactamase class C family)